MNERILKLYKQAQEFAYKNISKESWNTDNFHAVVSGKFAELIVQECVHVAVYKEDSMISTADVAGYMAAGRASAAKIIKQHFGVK